MKKTGTSIQPSTLAMLVAAVALSMTAVGQQPQSTYQQPKAANQAQQNPAPGPQAQSMSPESELLSKMHTANQMQIKAGQLAESKGTTQAIRNFGRLLVRDHSFADKKIKALASRQSIQLMPPMPKSPQEKQQMEMQKQMMAGLEQAQGADFDRQFIEFDLKSQNTAANTVSMASGQLKPSPVKALTSKMVPILKQHVEIAQHLEQRQTAGM